MRIFCALAIFFAFIVRTQAADNVIISEFMANNTGPLVDENGASEDWIELHNPDTNSVSLNGWYLTDNAGQLTKWQFPATNIAPNGYLIVWASNKDRRVPGKPLHTNFRLNDAGEYLGLVRPDFTIASQYSPTFPLQVPLVSYGVPLVQTITTLVATGAAARAYVPTNDILGSTWLAPAFDDSGWLPATTGVGYETDAQGAFTPVVVANSVTEFSGKQGSNNWYYGYWNRDADPNGVYSDVDMSFFPNADGPYGAANFFDGANWHWFGGNPPFTEITSQGATPNASNGVPARANHWAVRRWVSETAGKVKITGTLQHTGDWAYVTASGVAANSLLYLYLTAAGDGYIDDIKLVAGSVPEVGPNLMPNGDFESPLTPTWTVSDNHSPSAIVTDVKHGGNASLHMVATNGGTTQASAIWQTIAPALTVGNTYTLSYWWKPTSNNTPLVTRFSGNWIQVSPSPCGDGVTGRIFVDGVEVYATNVMQGSQPFTVTVPVNFGSRVDFALDPRTNDFCDASIFNALIETADPGSIVVADSVADWSVTGTQGEKNWYYGYYNRTGDPGGVYAPGDFTPFPRSSNPNGVDNYWTGTIWDWFNGNPPWDEISQTGWHPNGINNVNEHWVIRRWVSEVSGRITVDWTLAKVNLAGNGVSGRIMHNGNTVDSASIAGNNGAGVSRSITITNVAAGDFIDYALEPNGPGGTTDDGSDGSAGTMVIRGSPTLTSAIATDIQSAMYNVNPSAYIRIPFTVTDPSLIGFLTLSMKYDDGFAAYLNGTQVANRNAIDFQNPLTWNSPATANRADADVLAWEDIDITSFKALLTAGTNVLAIQGLNAHAADTDFLILPQLRGLNVTLGTNAGYFTSPTPGAANGPASTNIGPIVANVDHTPNVPEDYEDLTVTAQVAKSFNNVSNVTMIYRIAFSNEVTVPMLDDGLHGDGAAGDGIYGATIPASAAFAGQMIRYYVLAQDIKTNLSRVPAVTTANAAEPKYLGTIVNLPQTNGLPIFHWFIQTPSAAETEAGTRCSIFFRGQFRDNVGVTLHGQSSSGFPKKSYNINLNKGYKMNIRDGEPDASDFAITSTWADRIHVRNRINTEVYQEAGTPAHYSFALRVQQNETFFSVANLLEQGNEEYLERIGYDPDGALYKMYDTFVSVGTAEKKSRKYEGSGDLQTLLNAVSTVNPDVAGRTTYVWDNVNLPSMINFLAVKTITADHDCCHKNYYFYHDNNVSGEWYALPWDFDLSLSHIWTSGPGYFDDTTYTNNPGLGTGNNNTLIALLWNEPVLRAMWLRRIRTLMDTILQPPGTPTNTDYLRAKFDTYVNEVRADSALDKTKWGGAGWTAPVYGPANPTLVGNPTNNLEIELARIKDFYLPGRRTYLNTPATGLPTNMPASFNLVFGAIEYNPSSGNQAQEYVEIRNTNTFAVDISGWKLKGEADFTFLPGTVIGITNRIFLTPNLAAFRARPSGPRAGQRMFATGPYKNQLSARGDTLVLLNEAGQTNASLTYTGTPSLAQQYLRITEMMYHPPPPGISSPYPQEDYEYIELKNIGPVALNLNGVHFTNGIEFTFSSANVTNLNPGATLILAKNPAAFFFHYPGVTNVVTGPYIGLLENAGEKVELDDVLGEIILEFTYNNTWYPMTDGNGFSLVIVDENSSWKTWDDKAAWRPSGTVNGSPGTVDPAPVVVGAVVVNEVLAHTDFPDYDQIEIHNPTTNAVDVGDWWISDDFFAPRKYRIPAPRVIPPGGFAVFIESDFNAGPNAFLFNSHGDEAYIFSGLSSGELSGYYHGFSFGGSANGVSFGRHINSMTNEHFIAQGTNSFGATNTGPRVGPVIISELMYHPPDVNGSDNSIDEYVELRNLTTNAVPLYDPAYPTNRWRLDDGINYTFGTNDVVAAKGYLIVANFNPTNLTLLQAFRTKYGVATNIPIVGPYSGQLDNSEDTVELRRPDAPDTNGTPFILVERVHYLDSVPWDVGADGIGPSLQRRVTAFPAGTADAATYGNEPLNWFAALPNAGAPSSTGTPPVILQQPLDVLTIAGLTTNISLSVTGTAPLVYQWRKNGANLPGETNATIQFNPVQPAQAGLYSVAILNAAGYTVSSNALLTVRIPVAFTQQPTNQFVQPGTNVTVAAAAVGNGALHWQWRFEGTNIPGATSTNFSFLNANLTNGHGNFSVVVTDDISTATSTNAFVFVMVRPGIILQPLAQQVVQGNTAMFICQATGAPPIFYRWLTNGVGYLTNTSGIFIFPNVQTNYTVRANVVNGAGSVNSSSVALAVLRDFDGDGIADIWETNYFGFSTNNAADGLLDFDGDGMINRDEYYAGTNPTNALSLLKLVQSATNANVLQFVAQTNKTYTLLCRTNVADGLWSAVTNILPSSTVRTISVNSAVSPPLNPELYYRVITPFIP